MLGVKVTTDSWCDILSYDAEHWTSPGWADTIYDVDDGSNYLHGHVRWFGVAVGGAPDHVFDINGGSHVYHDEIGTAPGTPADILDIPTGETDTALVLAPDGAGGVEFRAEAGSAGRWELVVTGAAGPVLVTTDDTTDYIYAEVTP